MDIAGSNAHSLEGAPSHMFYENGGKNNRNEDGARGRRGRRTFGRRHVGRASIDERTNVVEGAGAG